MANLNDLIVAIDLSEDGPRVIALVCSREHILMPRSLLYATSWLRHYREVPSRLKKSYLRRFNKHYPRITEYTLLARVYKEKVGSNPTPFPGETQFRKPTPSTLMRYKGVKYGHISFV